MKKAYMTLALVFAFASGACATTGSNGESGDHSAMIAQAEEAYNAVEKAGGAWRDTGDMIKSAKEQAQAGNHDKAFQLAKQALRESKLAAEQLNAEGSATPWLF